MDYTAVTAEIEQAEIITIFRHEHPDCDALGSQWGFVNWLKENYPTKQVYALGSEKNDQGSWPNGDEVSDDVIQQSLAIVLDTGNIARIDDARNQLAKRIVKIDHHPNIEPFGDVMLVRTEAAATCEILATYFRSREDKKVSLKTAEYLYRGLLTDTLCYSTSNTTSNTLEIGSYLASKGINIAAINLELFDQDQKSFAVASYIRSHIQTTHGCIAYVVMTLDDLASLNVSASTARNFISEMGHVKEYEVWCLFTARVEGDYSVFDGSLRSKTIRLNDIAGKYNGGGHPNASGVKGLSDADIQNLLEEIYQRKVNA